MGVRWVNNIWIKLDSWSKTNPNILLLSFPPKEIVRMSDFPCDAYQSALNGARATGEGDTLDRGDGNENSQAQDMSNDMRVKFQNEGAHAGGGGDELGAAGGIPSHCLEDFKCPICLDTFINVSNRHLLTEMINSWLLKSNSFSCIL